MELVRFCLVALAEIRDPLLPLWAMELAAEVFFYVWLFALGATVGSFLNVVVYRLPRGKNLAYPGSYCPKCGSPIRLSDNIPILSWLALRGRCRDCQGAISPRYFFVELLSAMTFVIVLVGDYYLPAFAWGLETRRALTSYDGIPFWVMYGVHVCLVMTLLAAVLIAADGFRVSAALFLPVIAIGFIAPILWPQVRSIPAYAYRELPSWQAGLIDGLVGLVAGALVGLTFDAVAKRMGKAGSSFAPAALSASLGLVMGWQRVLWLAPVALLAAEWIAQGLSAFRAQEPIVNMSPVERSPPEQPSPEQPPQAAQAQTHDAIESIEPTEPTETS